MKKKRRKKMTSTVNIMSQSTRLNNDTFSKRFKEALIENAISLNH